MSGMLFKKIKIVLKYFFYLLDIKNKFFKKIYYYFQAKNTLKINRYNKIKHILSEPCTVASTW
jgi:hypothetical protein